MSHWPNCYGSNGLHLAFTNSGPRTDADIRKVVSAAISERLQIIKQVPRKDTLGFLLQQTDAWRLDLQAALVGVGAGQLCWTWHCAVESRDCAVSGVLGEREPVELL